MPTLFEIAGGETKLLKMTKSFFAKAQADEELKTLFEGASPEHAEHIAGWFCALFGGPKTYLTERGDLSWVIWSHRGMKITDAQRTRWVNLMLDSGAEAGMSEEFLTFFERFASSISRNVQENSHMDESVLRRAVGFEGKS